jgi:sorting nexin-9/18/33
MICCQVQALYDFKGEPGSAELSIVAGEVLTVTRQDVGEGWWEGTNQKGQTGLFPAAYVEVVTFTEQ